MEFEEFASKVGFEPSDLAEIGGLFGVASNTVWNWKSRNNVPAKYVLEAIRRGFIEQDTSKKAG